MISICSEAKKNEIKTNKNSTQIRVPTSSALTLDSNSVSEVITRTFSSESHSEAMESFGLNIINYTLLFVILSGVRFESRTSALDCILTLYVPHIKRTLDVIKRLHEFYEIIVECINGQKYLSIFEIFAKIIIESTLKKGYQGHISVISICHVSALQIKIKIHYKQIFSHI